MRAALTIACLIASVLPVPAFATQAVSDVIHRKLHDRGSWYTPGEAAFIRKQCGYRADEEIHDVNIEGDVMNCNGRRIQGLEVRVIASDVSRRANERVRAVINDPEVKAAINAAATQDARRALLAPR